MDFKMMLIALVTAVFAVGCVPGTVDGLFVSGHLGNYTDCPGDGYGGEESRALPSADIAAGACAEGTDCGGGPLNCEDAQVTLRLANTGDGAVDALQVEQIELVDHQGRVAATLPLMATTDTDSGEPFDGTLEPGEEVNLRIDFQGPADLSGVSSGADGERDSAFIHVTCGADPQPRFTVESDELYGLPSVVT